MLNTIINHTNDLIISEELLNYYVNTLNYSMFYFKDYEVLTTW